MSSSVSFQTGNAKIQKWWCCHLFVLAETINGLQVFTKEGMKRFGENSKETAFKVKLCHRGPRPWRDRDRVLNGMSLRVCKVNKKNIYIINVCVSPRSTSMTWPWPSSQPLCISRVKFRAHLVWNFLEFSDTRFLLMLKESLKAPLCYRWFSLKQFAVSVVPPTCMVLRYPNRKNMERSSESTFPMTISEISEFRSMKSWNFGQKPLNCGQTSRILEHFWNIFGNLGISVHSVFLIQVNNGYGTNSNHISIKKPSPV